MLWPFNLWLTYFIVEMSRSFPSAGTFVVKCYNKSTPASFDILMFMPMILVEALSWIFVRFCPLFWKNLLCGYTKIIALARQGQNIEVGNTNGTARIVYLMFCLCLASARCFITMNQFAWTANLVTLLCLATNIWCLHRHTCGLSKKHAKMRICTYIASFKVLKARNFAGWPVWLVIFLMHWIRLSSSEMCTIRV